MCFFKNSKRNLTPQKLVITFFVQNSHSLTNSICIALHTLFCSFLYFFHQTVPEHMPHAAKDTAQKRKKKMTQLLGSDSCHKGLKQ